MLSNLKKLRIVPRCQEPDSNLCRTRYPHVVNRLVRDQTGKAVIYRESIPSARSEGRKRGRSPCLWSRIINTTDK